MKFLCSAAFIVLFACNVAVATIFRDRTTFNAATQNLRTIDFENVPREFVDNQQIDGVFFGGINVPFVVTLENPQTRALKINSAGEITRLTVYLPPGTTAVGFDQFSRPMIISIPTGESVTMNDPNESKFVGFVTDQPIDRLEAFFDFPEPTPDAVIDNLSFGQRRAGNEPPLPQLLVTNNTGRALAVTSVMTESEPFNVISPHHWAPWLPDGRTRLSLFLVGVALDPSDLPFVTVQAENAQQNVFQLPVEATDRTRNLSWMSQVTVRLPDSLIGAGEMRVSITVRGATSNKAPLRID